MLREFLFSGEFSPSLKELEEAPKKAFFTQDCKRFIYFPCLLHIGLAMRDHVEH
jgi:hypothetical protein